MSDNLTVSQQQAVVHEDQPAEKMAPSSAEHTDGSNSFEEEEHVDEDAATNEQKEEAAEALAAIADAIKAGKGTKATKTSPKKRGTAGNDDQDGSPKKKRATAGKHDQDESPKKKGTTAVKEAKDGSSKKKRAPANGKAVKSEVKAEDDEVEVEGTTSGVADVTPEGSGADEDQVPVTPMKAKRSAAATPPTSTLPNRYKRLQLVMMQLDDNEVSPSTNSLSSIGSFAQLAVICQLLNSSLLISLATSSLHPSSLTSRQKSILQATKDEVEANWKKSKWALIATEMEKKSANKYPAEFLMKEWKKIEVARAAAAAAAANAAATAATAAGGDALLAAAQLAVGNTDEEVEEEVDEVEE
ncbi:MAG: hypothetical protein Q9208_001375 [Pyrenodesmia sp. 3 TL-2023]